MFRVFSCLGSEHDLKLVLVAALVCLCGSWTTLLLARRGVTGDARTRRAWMAAASVVAGCGIWATHFIAMLAFSDGLPLGYDPGLTALSVLVAIAGAGAAFSLLTGGDRYRLWACGAALGVAVGAMHYTGMAALQVGAFKTWDLTLIAASLLLGAVFAAGAVRMSLGSSGQARLAAGAILLTLGICALHFTGMGALQLEPTPLLPVPAQSVSSWWLAMSVAAAALIILVAAGAGMIFDNHLALRATRESERLRVLVDATFEGILIQADGVILDLNESLAALVKEDRKALVGRGLEAVLAPGWVERVRHEHGVDATEAHEAELIRADETIVPVEILGRKIEYNGRPAHVIAVRDMTERRASEQRIHQLAYHDPLTGLPNRALFHEHMQRALARVQRGGSLALLCLDLDRFKVVNDTLGHPIGDELLREASERLRACVRPSDLVARLGGDEFAIVQQHDVVRPVEPSALCRRLIEAFAKPFDIDGHRVIVGTSIGVALTQGEPINADTLLKSADLALYRAKTDGRGTWRFFEAEMDARMQERRAIELDLRQALASNQLDVHYQPFMDAERGGICGFEALVRWHHPRRGMVPPASFVPLAEEIGLIGEIGAWVLRRACFDAVQWPGAPRVAVNLSPAQFRDQALARVVAGALADSGLAASRLELEVTESLLLTNNSGVLAILHELRDLGVRIAMDDFGTGYSSLSYLQRFPFDKIKIDQSFVREMGSREDCAAIVRAVVGLGRSLGMAVNAEGVETEHQYAALRAEGCGEVQGYLFSTPRPACEIPDMLRESLGPTAPTAPKALEQSADQLLSAA